MQSRCCWPPDSSSAERVEAIGHLVPEGGLLEAALHDLLHRQVVAQPVDARPVGDVLEDRLGERVGLLEHHADPPSQDHRVDVLAVEVLAVDRDAALDAGAADVVVHPVQAAQERRLAAAGRSDERGHAALRDVQRHVGERPGVAVVHGKLPDGDLGRGVERRSGEVRP